jgi:DNA-binding transcriptional ArsR family regulator
MRSSEYSSDAIAKLLRKQKIATMAELMQALGSPARRTVFRKLAELPYRASYSHRGSYYTLDEIAHFDEQGLWSHRDVWFSVHGTLLSAAAAMVEAADSGLFVDELDNALHISTKDVLRKLVQDARLTREPLGGQFLYCAADPDRRRQQRLARRTLLAAPGVARALPEPAVLPDELRAAIVLFFSLLDEKQRRLYAGLEALKTGHGGDVRIAELLGLDAGTVSRGRHELLAQEVEPGRVRGTGGGRRPVEKKRRKSSPTSKR